MAMANTKKCKDFTKKANLENLLAKLNMCPPCYYFQIHKRKCMSVLVSLLVPAGIGNKPGKHRKKRSMYRTRSFLPSTHTQDWCCVPSTERRGGRADPGAAQQLCSCGSCHTPRCPPITAQGLAHDRCTGHCSMHGTLGTWFPALKNVLPTEE